jgi:uncharacterized protein
VNDPDEADDSARARASKGVSGAARSTDAAHAALRRRHTLPTEDPTVNQMLFVNLPVRDTKATRKFFEALGYTFQEKFSNDQGLCMVVSETSFVMLLERSFFGSFTKLPVADATRSCQTILCVSAPSRAAVDAMLEKAKSLGATEPREPQTMGDFMYYRSFADLDGHVWEVMWMDPVAAERGCPENAASARSAEQTSKG